MHIVERHGRAPAPGFDDPLGLLAACHERIENHCQTLLRLQEHVVTHGFDADAQLTARRVLHYFDEAGRRHHEDEEQDLQPLLLPYRNDIRLQEWDRLMAEHRSLEALYKPLAEVLAAHDPGQRSLPAGPFVDLMRTHLVVENTLILPAARSLLTASELTELGQAMARRRGIRCSVRR